MPIGRIPEKYQRSTDYRTQYIKWHPGVFGKFYMCPYCGKIIRREKMEVDHIIPVDATRKYLVARWLLPSGVNSKQNMVSACHTCNHKKSNKGGLWIVRGIIGKVLQPIIWILLIIFLVYFFWNFFVNGFSQECARNFIINDFRIFTEYIKMIFNYIFIFIVSSFHFQP